MSVTRYSLYGVFLVIICGCSTTQQQVEKALNLDVDHFKQTMQITDDQMETTVAFSTAGGFVQKHGLLGIVWSDSFLRGYIDKRTGNKTFQCYVALRHTEGNWAHPYQANYGRPLRTEEVTKVHSDVDCSASDLYGSCKYEEHIVFNIHPDEVLRIWMEVTPEDFKDKVWKFRIKNRGTQDYDDGILLPEMLALVETMNDYQFEPMQ